MNSYSDEQQKINQLKSLLSSKKYLDKCQLSVLFEKGGFSEINEKVLNTTLNYIIC